MTQSRPTVVAQGTYVPGLRLPAKEIRDAWGVSPGKGVEALSLPAFDEDAATLAWEAARRALSAWGGKERDLGAVTFATSGPEDAAALVAAALGATGARVASVTGNRTAGVAALLQGLDAVQGLNAPALVVAADLPRGKPVLDDHRSAGAAAFVVTPGGDGATIARSGAGAADPTDPASARVALDGARGQLGKPPEKPAFHLAFPGGGSLRNGMGEAGAAHPLLELAQALREPGDGVLEVADRGAALTIHVHVQKGIEGAPVRTSRGREIGYLRAMQTLDLVDVDAPGEPMGAYVSLQAFAETLPARYRLEAARCADCGRLAYPPRSACPDCSGTTFRAESLSPECALHSFTVIGRGGAPSEFAREQALTGAYVVGVVEFKEGPRVTALLADADPDGLEIGAPLTPVLRRLYFQQGTVRYGLKFALGEKA